VVCLVYSDNERDPNVLTRGVLPGLVPRAFCRPLGRGPCFACGACKGRVGGVRVVAWGSHGGWSGGALAAAAYKRELLLRRIEADKVSEMG